MNGEELLPPQRPIASWKFAVRALKYKNYRLFFSGQLLSNIGTWLTMVATGWLVYRLAVEAKIANPAFIMGAVTFSGQVPQLLFGPFAGVWVDRLDKHKILLATQTLSMLQSFALAYLALTHTITIPWIIALNAFQGIVNALDMPARQALVIDMVTKREDLSNAIALSSSMVHCARLLGPAVAGFLIYHFGEGYCFLIDGISYLAVLTSLLYMQLPKHVHVHTAIKTWQGFKDGFAYAYNFPPIRLLLVLLGLTSILTMSQTVLMPIFADKILGGGERMYGLLLGASGFGALVASIYLASRKSVVGLGKIIASAEVAMGLSLIAFAVSRWVPLSLVLLFVNGAALVLMLASGNTILQTIVDPDKRGRVMSLFAMSFMGLAPIGSLAGGAIASRVGAPWTIAIAGMGCLIIGWGFIRRFANFKAHVRPVYERMGILEKRTPSP